VSLIQQIVVQLALAVSAFLVGVFWQRIRATWFYFSARRFWRPLLHRDLALVLGDGFPDLRGFEASDLIGRGDLVASYELTNHFSRMGFKRLQPVFADLMIGDDLTGRSLRRNMVVLGGPDANRVSLKCLTGMEVSYKLVWPEQITQSAPRGSLNIPKLEFTKTAEQNESLSFQPSVEDNEVVKDYGIIIRARNPLDFWGKKQADARRGKQVVIIYGCYGYGTLAAVLYSQTREFLEMVNNGKDDIECVVVCRVVMGTPQAIDCAYFKAHPHGSLTRRMSGQPDKSEPIELQ
jgi:hypothetical protein